MNKNSSNKKYVKVAIFPISKFNTLSKSIVKKIKIFYNKVINEPFHYALKDDPIWIADPVQLRCKARNS